MQITYCDMSLPRGGEGGGQRSTNYHYNFLSLPEGKGRGVEEVGPMSLFTEFFFVDGIPKRLKFLRIFLKFFHNETQFS